MFNSYSALGKWFEYLNDNWGYSEWLQHILDILHELNAGRDGVDIGCGNGYFTRSLKKAGYDVVGVDLSPQMLNRAKEVSLQEGVSVEFFLADIAKLKLNRKVDFAIAVNDCINYVPKNKLKCAFNHVKLALKKGGVFIFDISSEYKLKNILANNLFAEDREKVTYLWFNTLKDDRVEMDITLFEKDKDDKYIRNDESQTQYIYGEKEIISALSEYGFEVIKTEYDKQENAERINFICKRL